jgi:catechol 2,3-dioxygenase-like lactoylglutathione lyase family enzyme
MFDHVGLHVRDLIASRKFYAAVLETLGHVQDSSGTGFGSEGAPALWLYETKQASGGAHLAFVASSRAVVDGFHRAGLGAGGRDNGAPGLRADYGASYYAAFLLDPDGNNVEAVCLREMK